VVPNSLRRGCKGPQSVGQMEAKVSGKKTAGDERNREGQGCVRVPGGKLSTVHSTGDGGLAPEKKTGKDFVGMGGK